MMVPPFVCHACGFVATTWTNLAAHVRIHTGHAGASPFPCSVCNKGFTSNWKLKRHMTVHTGEKPYKCNICGKRFSVKDNMRTHQITHMKVDF
jgi:KRAB domain-containing zinc finger protein